MSVDSKPPTEDFSAEDRVRWANTLANTRVLEGASAQTVEALISSALFRRFESDASIVRADQPVRQVHFLVEGVARVVQAHGPTEYTAKILVPPSHFGELSALAGLATNRSSISSLTPVVTASVPIGILKERLAIDPVLCRSWLSSLARQFSVTIDFLRQNIFLGVPARVANVLLSYSDAFGEAREGGWRTLGYTLSYAQLARQCACTRRSAINTMNAFVEDGLIDNRGPELLIRADRLKDALLPGRLSLTYAQDDSADIEG